MNKYLLAHKVWFEPKIRTITGLISDIQVSDSITELTNVSFLRQIIADFDSFLLKKIGVMLEILLNVLQTHEN